MTPCTEEPFEVNPTLCPCDRSLPFEDCCAPLLAGRKLPERAVDLMRSRYCAFALGLVEYLLQSWHPSTRPVDLDLSDDPTVWESLEILEYTKGSQQDQRGTVEFRARYRQGIQSGAMQELSYFRREAGRWLYVRGEIRTEGPSSPPGRNAPCPCGSGLKYKRCCAV